MIQYSNYNLPDFLVGVAKERPSPMVVSQPLFGKAYTELACDDFDELPAQWDVEMFCDSVQSAELLRLYDDVRSDPDGAFEKDVATEFGRNVNAFKFIDGRPQPVRVGQNLFRYRITLYSDTVDSTIDTVVTDPAPGVIARWSDWGLPDFQRGYKSSQIDPVERTPIFEGKLYEQEMTIDLPVQWKVEVLCQKLEARTLCKLVRDKLTIAGKHFIHPMTTPQGKFEQYLRIVSGVPQGEQVRRDIWRFEMTLESPFLNTTIATLPSIGIHV